MYNMLRYTSASSSLARLAFFSSSLFLTRSFFSSSNRFFSRAFSRLFLAGRGRDTYITIITSSKVFQDNPDVRFSW